MAKLEIPAEDRFADKIIREMSSNDQGSIPQSWQQPQLLDIDSAHTPRNSLPIAQNSEHVII